MSEIQRLRRELSSNQNQGPLWQSLTVESRLAEDSDSIARAGALAARAGNSNLISASHAARNSLRIDASDGIDLGYPQHY